MGFSTLSEKRAYAAGVYGSTVPHTVANQWGLPERNAFAAGIRVRQRRMATSGAKMGSLTGPAGPPISSGRAAPTGQPASVPPRANTRFRSFAERYLIARAEKWPADTTAWDDKAWEAVQGAKTAYEMIKRVSTSVYDNEEER